ncbi:hypothetical protein CAEBREN_07247 [Caenorhabditis brenneri]|uniref:Uncharacterized protein n=1 Tax=Caenorhabditis brenneri TaxID=135651 RepID=G0P3Q1_CAEBE|nr:hypothetical protein CAEBREN_07247 [Caenorhabditis brenneri]
MCTAQYSDYCSGEPGLGSFCGPVVQSGRGRDLNFWPPPPPPYPILIDSNQILQMNMREEDATILVPKLISVQITFRLIHIVVITKLAYFGTELLQITSYKCDYVPNIIDFQGYGNVAPRTFEASFLTAAEIAAQKRKVYSEEAWLI